MMDYDNKIKRVLYTEEEVRAAIKAAGKKISEKYDGKALLLVGFLKGSFVFLADLLRAIDIPCEVTFMAAKVLFPDDKNTNGTIHVKPDMQQDVQDYHVILVEDIVDSGLTLSRLKSFFLSRNPASLKICCLLDKKERRQTDIEVDYSCFTIPDAFVVGYGLDYDSRYRNLPDIMVLDESVYNH